MQVLNFRKTLQVLPSQRLKLRMRFLMSLCPLNYGFGVKQSDIFGVQRFLRKERSSYVNHGAVEVENLKAALSAIKKQNEDLQQKNEALETMLNETSHTFSVVASQLGEVIEAVHNGNASSQLLDGAESAIHIIGSQLSKVSSADGNR